MIEPIEIKQKDSIQDGPIYEHFISAINEAISLKLWHDNWSDPEDVKEKYYAIIMNPYEKVRADVLDRVVLVFKKKGWDCDHGPSYDARGPHHHFYINKTHFEDDQI